MKKLFLMFVCLYSVNCLFAGKYLQDIYDGHIANSDKIKDIFIWPLSNQKGYRVIADYSSPSDRMGHLKLYDGNTPEECLDYINRLVKYLNSSDTQEQYSLR